MLAELAKAYPQVQPTFAEASDVLGYDLWRLVQEGPEAHLNRTDRTQPAMLAAGVAVWRVWQAQGGLAPTFMAGHSLGEFTALVCAGALRFVDAIGVVARRGEFMQEAVPQGRGAMAAILGLSDDEVRAVCADAAQGEVVEAVNFNSPGQVVVAGDAAAVERAMEAAKSRGAKRAVTLPVSVPSHCELMRPAAGRLSVLLQEVAIERPFVPVIHNVDVATHDDPVEIRQALIHQLYCPVRWVETVARMSMEGVTRIVEAGPGKVLTGLNKRISKDTATYGVYDPATLAAALSGA